MKVTLEFDGWDERTEALQAQHAVDYIVALDKIQRDIRARWKATEFETDEAVIDVIEEIHDFVSGVIAELPEYDV